MKALVVAVGFLVTLARFVVPAPAVPQLLPNVLQLHGYPYGGKTAYLSRSEWDQTSGRPPLSSQGHWKPSNAAGTLGHTHVECWAPIYAEIPAGAFSLPCRAQLFHVSGSVGIGYGNQPDISWELPGPVVGDPSAVVIRNFTATFPANGRIPHGRFNAMTALFTYLSDGTIQNSSLSVPLFSVSDVSVPEADTHWSLRADAAMFPSSPTSHGNGHGQSIVECHNADKVYLPILTPVTERIVVPCVSYGYARSGAYTSTALDEIAQMLDPDLHAGNPGTEVYRLTGDAAQVINVGMIFDPAGLSAGLHKYSLSWCQDSGPGNPPILPGEQLCALLVVPFTVGSVVPPDPTPPPCAGTWGWSFSDISASVRSFTRIFTKSLGQPMNCVMPVVPIGG